MGSWIEQRWRSLRAAVKRKPVKWTLYVCGAVGLYDTFGAQFAPDGLQERLPRAYDVIVMTSGFLPFWAWAMIFMAIIVVAAVDYAVRQSGGPGDGQSARPSPDDIKALELIPTIRASTSITALEPPDFTKWDKRKSFRLWEAACLSANQEPQQPLSSKATVFYQQLVEAIYDSTLPVHGDDLREVIAHRQLRKKGSEVVSRHHYGRFGTEPNPQWVVTLEDLTIYYQAKGEKPPFLFPKKRI